jgi:hypothetical protein
MFMFGQWVYVPTFNYKKSTNRSNHWIRMGKDNFCWAKLNQKTLLSTPPQIWKRLQLTAAPAQRANKLTRGRVNCQIDQLTNWPIDQLTLYFYTFQASLNHRANACSC